MAASSAQSRPPDGGDQAGPGPAPDDAVVVGRITGPHGLRGEVKVVPETDFPERLTELGHATLLLLDGQLKPVSVVSGRPHVGKGTVLLRFEGVTDRTDADAFRGALIVVRPEESPALPEGHYYDWQILGLHVVTEDERDLGTVREVIHTGANDVYVTDTCLLPAIETVIKRVDLSAGRMVVELLPGLVD